MVNHEAQSSAGAGNLSVKSDKLCGEYMNSVVLIESKYLGIIDIEL